MMVCSRCLGRGWYRQPDPAGRGDDVVCERCVAPEPVAVRPTPPAASATARAKHRAEMHEFWCRQPPVRFWKTDPTA